jgi:hypothetical protein
MNGKKKDIKPLVVRIEGTRITAQKFLQVANNFFGLLQNVADEISEQERSVTWLVTAERGSQILTAIPEVDEANVKKVQLITKAIYNGCRQIEKKGIRPSTFSDTALRHVKDMATAIGNEDGDVSKITLSYDKQSNNISRKTSLHIEDILAPKRTEDGSIEGRVTVLSEKKRLKVYIDDVLTGHTVRCTPRDVDEEYLIGAFRRRIVAIGTVHYRSDGAPVRIEVDEIRVLGKRDTLPTFGDVKGIFRQGS